MVIGVGGRKEMIATKDKDVFMTCVVHNKPANRNVREKIMTCLVHNKPANKKVREKSITCIVHNTQ